MLQSFQFFSSIDRQFRKCRLIVPRLIKQNGVWRCYSSHSTSETDSFCCLIGRHLLKLRILPLVALQKKENYLPTTLPILFLLFQPLLSCPVAYQTNGLNRTAKQQLLCSIDCHLPSKTRQ